MREGALRFPLDQNVPVAITAWLKEEYPSWISP
jgi:hypothetical protein